MNIYKVRARLKLDQVRADIADLPDDDTTTFALRGIADLIELVLAEPDRRADADDTFVRPTVRDVIYAEADADYTDADRNSGIHRVGIDD